ncbi:MAG: rhamnulokinase family protein [Prevotella sp.]|nr:rhamnulokinase [Prevotella sp.]MCI6500356.1 rhamnulokinase [Prevotella sp.]MCI7360614.1 rhamnulokinase [Prevotella sp.]MCI7686998.1 rhamnulokinase [Prevotella sp.]MDY3897149.1 rhamnulokinase family protein [Prevotella sp.]
MEQPKHFFAVDLGATSGRTIIGTIENGKMSLEELTRFDNNLIETGGHFYWDIFALYNEVINGLRLVAKRQIEIQSIGIDTWGVDFVCVGSDGAILRNPLAYRDPHTVGKMEEYFEKKVARDEVYNITGIQFMNFNSLFQLYAMDEAGNTALRNADKVLFVPDALSYMLTGNAVCEYTIASTSQMLDPRTKDLDSRLVESVGLKRGQFGEMVNPATVIGTITEEVQKMTGLGAVPVIAVAGHDTGSAVAAVPAANEKFAYLSSGTWSLMGIETQDAIINARSFDLNFTNEGGIEGTTRFLKNICGMWIYERCRKEWKDAEGLGHAELQSAAMECEPFRSLINPDDPIFANPASMVDAITTYCEKTNQPIPQGYAQTCRCIFDSLALRYRQVFAWLKEFADFDINVLHIIGGGSKNEYLDQFTANSCGVTVLAGPQEGTAIGNIMLQAKAAGMVGDIWEMRRIIADSLELKRFEPQDKEIWDAAYEKYLDIVNLKG